MPSESRPEMIHIRRADFESIVKAMEELNRTIGKAASNAEMPKPPKPRKKNEE